MAWRIIVSKPNSLEWYRDCDGEIVEENDLNCIVDICESLKRNLKYDCDVRKVDKNEV